MPEIQVKCVNLNTIGPVVFALSQGANKENNNANNILVNSHTFLGSEDLETDIIIKNSTSGQTFYHYNYCLYLYKCEKVKWNDTLCSPWPMIN